MMQNLMKRLLEKKKYPTKIEEEAIVPLIDGTEIYYPKQYK